MKHTSWLSGLAAVRRPSAAASARTSVLGHPADREQHARELDAGRAGAARRTGPWRVGAAGDAAGPVGSTHHPGVVTGGDRVEPQQLGPSQQHVELEVAVALDARVGRPAGGVVGHVRLDDELFELVAEVEHVVVDADLRRGTAGVVDVGGRAAAGVGLASPQLHRDADHIVALGHEHRRRDR